MIVTFGYLTMFASTFTLSGPVIYVFILIEVRSDIFRLDKTLRRPIPYKTNHIGSWSYIIEIFCFLGVFSNLIITCYASDQIDHLFPWMAHLKGDSKYAIATIFGLEHILLGSLFFIRMFYDINPEWVDVFMARKAHREDRELH